MKSRWCSYCKKKKKKRLRYWKEYFNLLTLLIYLLWGFLFQRYVFTSESCFDPYDQILNAKSRSWHVWEYKAAVCFSTDCTVLYQTNSDFVCLVTTMIKFLYRTLASPSVYVFLYRTTCNKNPLYLIFFSKWCDGNLSIVMRYEQQVCSRSVNHCRIANKRP